MNLCDGRKSKDIRNNGTVTSKAKYLHDCDKCKFLGHHLGYDMYYCDNLFGPTLLFRYGIDYDYESYPYIVHEQILSNDNQHEFLKRVRGMITVARSRVKELKCT